MGFARAEKAGYPNTVGAFIVSIGIEKGLKALGHLIGQYVFFNFELQALLIVGFDDPFNMAIDRFLKHFFQRHEIILELDFAVIDVKSPVVLVIVKTSE